MKNKLTKEQAINVLNYVIEYFEDGYDTGDKESNAEEIDNAWNALEVLKTNKGGKCLK